MMKKIAPKVWKLNVDSNIYFLDFDEKIIIDAGPSSYREIVKEELSKKIDLAKVPERQLDLITDIELCHILDAPNTLNLTGLRDKAILEILFSTGLRVSELCSLNRNHFTDAKAGEISIRGKGGKIRA